MFECPMTSELVEPIGNKEILERLDAATKHIEQCERDFKRDPATAREPFTFG